MRKKTKKTKDNIWDKIFSKKDNFLSSGLAVDLLFGFLLFISAAYGLLIWGIGEKIRIEEVEPARVAVSRPSPLEKEIREMVADHPIKNMTPYISKQDKQIAAFVLAIAKKESNWGKYSPKKDGRDCFNYWGYRGGYNQTRSGYSCFDSPGQAVEVVSGRISDLISQKIDTPDEMVIWKCGSTCEGHDPAGVRKWISDVGYYYGKL
jgi:hypothetical protein